MKAGIKENINVPQVGMLAIVRNRRALIASVEPFDGKPEGRIHLVCLEYTDIDGNSEDSIIWEREINARLLEPTALPSVTTDKPMLSTEFDALQRATRWTALSPFFSSTQSSLGDYLSKQLFIAAPLFGAVQVEDFQLIPLLKALQMSRISLLLSDDVGLGKTIETGLIITELIIRRRIRRVLILTPAALRNQWQEEMKNKFAVSFDIVDRAETHALQKRLGLDANPWRTYPRIITSYHYLRQPDVLGQFLTTCRTEGASILPWDLLIVDEAHNLMPAKFGEDSDLAKMLRLISPYFEHKLFLTATPHNGHTRCFSGLLEQLDPVRFNQTNELTNSLKQRISEVVIRRLKREINQLDEKANRTPRFGDRTTQPIPIFFDPLEESLSRAFSEFRQRVKILIGGRKKTDQLAGNFAVEVLNKRLLSCSYTFANSWYRFQQGIKQQELAEAGEVEAAKRAVQEDLDDDQETEERWQHAAKITGAWLKPLVPELTEEIANINYALSQLGLVELKNNEETEISIPNIDRRFDCLLKTIKQFLRSSNKWVNTERLVIFTEYKTTLDYLEKRLKEIFKDDGSVIQMLYGGLQDKDRQKIKEAFNDPNHPMRILIATDAASEGLNLQESARLVLHYDIPWNPARLEQRNGRLDRHGQGRDVIVFHFTSENDADLKFLAQVVAKVNTIREDLGSMGEVFDQAFQQRFVDLQDGDQIVEELDKVVKKHIQRDLIPRELPKEEYEKYLKAFNQFEREIDLTPITLKNTLEMALSLGIGMPRFEGPDEQGKLRLRMPIPREWESLIDDHLRLETEENTRGPLPAIIFDPQQFVIKNTDNGRAIFRPSKDTVLLHLGHPLFRKALALFAQVRFPGNNYSKLASRWTVRYGEITADVDAVLLITVEELAINNLREPFHHWVKTIRLPIKNNSLGEPLPHITPLDDLPSETEVTKADIEKVKDLWSEINLDVRDFIKDLTNNLTKELEAELKKRKAIALKEEKDNFKSRLSELNKAMNETTLQKLEKELEELKNDMQQLSLFPNLLQDSKNRMQDLEDELNRRRSHYQQLLDFLQLEQERIIEKVIPQRYQLRGEARVFPVMVEIRIKEK